MDWNVLPCLSPRPDTEGRICLSSLESVPVRSEEQQQNYLNELIDEDNNFQSSYLILKLEF